MTLHHPGANQMKQQKWLKIALSLYLTTFSLSSNISAQPIHAFPNGEYQMMNLPSDDLTLMNSPMDTPAMGFAVVDDGAGGEVSYGLPEAMIRKVGVFYDDEGECCAQFGGAYLLGLEFAAGNYIAINRSYGGINFLAVPEAPFEYTNTLLNLKAYKVEGRGWAGSLGVGFRHFERGFKKVYGVNFFYDYLDSRGTYNQFGLGFELFDRCWEFHLNGYLPLGKTHHTISEKIINFKSGFVGIFRDVENALRGVELSAGWRWYLCDNLNLYIAPGAYFYHNKDIRRNIQGAQGTVEINWHEWVSFRLNASYDRCFNGRVQGVVAVNIPLNYCCDTCDCCNVCGCCNPCDLLCYPVRRNDLIFLKTCCSVEKNWDVCGKRKK